FSLAGKTERRKPPEYMIRP
ncbi:hypothetical protein CGMCC3_g17953, partial [Colletotrichum fructicola]